MVLICRGAQGVGFCNKSYISTLRGIPFPNKNMEFCACLVDISTSGPIRPARHNLEKYVHRRFC